MCVALVEVHITIPNQAHPFHLMGRECSEAPFHVEGVLRSSTSVQASIKLKSDGYTVINDINYIKLLFEAQKNIEHVFLSKVGFATKVGVSKMPSRKKQLVSEALEMVTLTKCTTH